MSRVIDAVDGFQRRHRVVGLPLAVLYKYFDDQGNYLAAMLTYYAFIAIFPLMLLGTSILGYALQGEPQWQEAILDSALAQFPIIGDQLGRPEGLTGSVAGVILGSLAALYGAMGLGQSVQNAHHVAWAVPRNRRPNPLKSRLKTLGLLVLAGGLLLALTIVTTMITNTEVFDAAVNEEIKRLIPFANILIVGTGATLLFRFAATGQHSFRRAAPGGYLLGVLWQLLQYGGAWYVERVLVNTSSMAQTFGLVLGLMGFLFLGAVMAVMSIELNVVLARTLYPRALLAPFVDDLDLTDADRRAYASYVQAQQHKVRETVHVRWEEPDDPADDGP